MTPPLDKSAGCCGKIAPSHRERDDGYSGALVQLTTTERIALCRDNLQYIYQRRHRDGSHGGAWRAVSYATNKSSIVAIHVSTEALLDPETRAALDALPERARDAEHLRRPYPASQSQPARCK
jgi:hypothetical protein